MISDADIDRVIAASERFSSALIGARYHPDSDRIELSTSWCTILVDRLQIAELRDVPRHDLETISVSPFGLHIESADIDINAGGLLAHIGKKLTEQAVKSF
jgi:hypothetical protein